MTTIATREFPDSYVNPRGIPRVDFVGNVEHEVKSRGLTPDSIINTLQVTYSKLKLMEHKLTQNRVHLEPKIPEIIKTIETIELLKNKAAGGEQLNMNFGLTESVFVEAAVPPQETVHLWLGANVMVEYTLDEALALLEKNLDSAKTNLANVMEDLAWLRDQIVVVEVNIARVYNYDVLRRRAEEKKSGK